MNEELAPVWVKSDNEAADSRLDDLFSKRDRVTPKACYLGLKIRDLKSNQRTTHWCGMIRISWCDRKGGVANDILDPIVADGCSVSAENCVKKLARRRDVPDWINDERYLDSRAVCEARPRHH